MQYLLALTLQIYYSVCGQNMKKETHNFRHTDISKPLHLIVVTCDNYISLIFIAHACMYYCNGVWLLLPDTVHEGDRQQLVF